MKKILYIGLALISLLQACGQNTSQQIKINNDTLINEQKKQARNVDSIINPQGNVLQTRILPPNEFQRINIEKNSFAEYLRQLPLKPHSSEVKLYDGSTKPNINVYVAVVSLGIGKKDLHQCADAVMRLKAEYLWTQKQYEKIHFNLTNGFRVDYSEWMKGKRIIVKGNSTYWTQKGNPSNSYQDFWSYMELIFNYAGTLSLAKELKPVNLDDLKIGDVFIRGGSPGHAVIVIDIAINATTNKKIFLLAQSYMPAQEIQILQNPNDNAISPWYSADISQILYTPEWTFDKSELKRFEE